MLRLASTLTIPEGDQPLLSQTDSSDSPRDAFAEDADSTFAGKPNFFDLL